MSYYSNWLIKCKNLTQKMYTFRKKKTLLKVKMPIKGKYQFKLIGKYYFLSLMWTDHTGYEEYQKLQLSTVVRYQHNNTLGKISSNYRYRKNHRKYRDISFCQYRTPLPSRRSKPIRPSFIFRTQIKIFLMKYESFLTLHRQQRKYHVQGPER